MRRPPALTFLEAVAGELATRFHLTVDGVMRSPVNNSVVVTTYPRDAEPGELSNALVRQFEISERQVWMWRDNPRNMIRPVEELLLQCQEEIYQAWQYPLALRLGLSSRRPIHVARVVRLGRRFVALAADRDDEAGPRWCGWQVAPRMSHVAAVTESLPAVLGALIRPARRALWGMAPVIPGGGESPRRPGTARGLDHVTPAIQAHGWDEERCSECHRPASQVIDLQPSIYSCGAHAWLAGQPANTALW